MSKPTIPQGTRDFGAAVVRRRQYIFDTIRRHFERYGFEPLETPAMEQLETLMGKYGEEGDKLIFRILNNGLDRPEKHDRARADFEKLLEGKQVPGITERALRYDLTIPFARYVAMNHGSLAMPYKRYQMQPVWRADRPQKGRYREFYQCDADVVGSKSLINERELTNLYADVFSELGLPVEIRINHRQVLAGLAEACGGAGQMTAITVAIDKLDKIGLEKVRGELRQRGLQEDAVNLISRYLEVTGANNTEKLTALRELLGNSASAAQGLNELEWLLNACAGAPVVLDPSLARGLNYYTGVIFEVKAVGVSMGSIGGGGRYDDLTGLFGVPGIPGVGISFGVDRIYDVMESLELFPAALATGTQVLFFNLGAEESSAAYENMQALRQGGWRCELYPEPVKWDKQFKYADRKQIPLAVIIGSDELTQGVAVVRHLASGRQEKIALAQLAESLRGWLEA